MPSIKFIIRTTQKTKLAKVYVRLYEGKAYDFNASAGYYVMPDSWSNKTQSFKPRFKFSDEFTEQQARDMENKFEDLRNLILKAVNNNRDKPIDKSWLEKIIHDFHNPTVALEKSKMTLVKYIEKFAAEMESGARLNVNKLRYSHSTVKNYKGFVVQFAEFSKAKRKKYDFADINMAFYDDFVAYFTKKNYSINTIGRHVKELKIIMRAARDEGLHNNSSIESRKFRVLTAEVENIYLTETELKAIAAVDLKGNKAKEVARDVFLVGCYTAQRYSDYSTINEGNIRKLENGQTVIDLKQQKTGNHVVIPARPEVLTILAKYGNSMPKSYEQKVNKHIKEIAREAKITESIEIEYIENGEKKRKTEEKCDLVKTHTARRSGATNMYLAGIPSISIMKITGHKTEKEFMKYLKISEEETAIELMSHPFFSGKPAL